MPWKGLKIGGGHKSGNERPRNSNSAAGPRLSEQLPRAIHSSGHLSPRVRESLALPNKLPSASLDHGERAVSGSPDRLVRAQNTKRNRFSLLRFRHASDSQLSAAYQEGEPPPVPPIPENAQPPKIIRTSPTTDNLEQSAKRKSIFSIKPQKTSLDRTKSTGNGAPAQLNPPLPLLQSSTAPPSVRASHISFEEPQERLSTTSVRSGPVRGQDGTHPGLLPAPRLSESSRSEASSADQGVYNGALKTDASSSTSSFFRIPRLKKNRHSLFPFPMKVPPQHIRNDQQSRAVPATSTEQDRELLSTLPSPSRTSLSHPTTASASPDPNLIRKNSTSANSVRSSLSLKMAQRPTRRGRSSTIGSLADIQDDTHHSSPDMAPSSRTSTFTAPRKSFSDLFSRPKHHTDSHAGTESAIPGTPQSMTSKQNSFSIAREIASRPAREPDDTPATYLTRLESAVHKAAVATILAESVDEFYQIALKNYMHGFSFKGDSMDMSIRKFLMEAELPKETQQIDRVLQCFAERYHECNAGVFASTEQAYFIAFSLLILHTDVFNKNNKRKMQKHDYVRNTRGEGLAEEILECFYDNISYTPFIHVEDEINHGVRRLAPKTRSPLFKVSSSDNLAKGPLDPYALILEGKLHILRPNLKDVMELDDVYSASGPGYTLDMNGLHEAFYRPCVLQIVSERSRPDAFMKQSSIANPLESQPGLVDIRVAKVGLLWRKDPKKKKTRSPWQEWGAVLTGSQLYLFKDVPWVKTLISQYETKQKRGRRQPVIFKPPITDFKPDAIMSTADAVALLDASYKRHKHAFLFVRHGGFEEVFLANSDTEMNDWMATINYGAAFRTTGVRMRGMIGANYEGQPPQRTVRSSSVTSETSETPTVSELTTSNTRTMDPRLAEEIFAARRELVSTRIREANEKLSECNEQLEDLLRNARHLQILMPLHPRARDQVVLAAGRMAAKIKWARLEVWRTKCHRDVLALDLAEEEKGLSVKKVAKSCSPSRNEAFSISSQDHALPSESAPSLVPTSPKSTRSSKQFRSRSPTPTGEARNPEKLVENLPPQVLRPGLPKARTSTDLTISSRKTSSSENKDSLNVDSMKRMGNSVPVLRQVSATSSSSRLDPNATPRQSSAQRAPKTPTPSMLDTEEDRLLREAGILSNELLTHMSSTSDPVDGSSNTGNDGRGDTPSSESRGKVRRSLHRTLREGHFIPHHQRSKKGKDSGTTVSTVDEANPASETEVLARSTGSFTLHGKKASVVTFGSEWENISPEQRLKQRKPMPSEDSRASDMMELDSQSDATPSENTNLRKTYSLRSISTATGRSLRLRDGERLGVLPSPGASLTDTLREELTAAMDTDSAVIMEEEETFYDAGEVPVTPTEQTEKLPSPSSEEQTPIVAESELETGLSKCDHSSPVLNHAVAEQTVRVQ